MIAMLFEKGHPVYGGFQKGNTLGNKFKKNDAHPGWKGSEVKYRALHQWIGRNKPKPELCEECNIKPPFDAACITGIYNRDLENWKWLCRKCHMKSEGRTPPLQVRKAK